MFLLLIFLLVTHKPHRNEAISTSIKQIEANPKVQSVIIASSNPSIFSAGLDIAELVEPDKDRLPKFWNSLQQVYLDLYGSRLATIAAIQGHAPAAGCMLAMACDYRIMCAGHGDDEVDGKKRRKHVPTIGLNETQLGIAAPPWMGQLMVRTIGFRMAERALALGTLFQPTDALKVGLVDEVVSEQTADVSDALMTLLTEGNEQVSNPLMQKAYREAALYAKIPPQARVASKMVTRSDCLQDMFATREADNDFFCGFIGQDEVQKNLKGYVEALKQKSKKV